MAVKGKIEAILSDLLSEQFDCKVLISFEDESGKGADKHIERLDRGVRENGGQLADS